MACLAALRGIGRGGDGAGDARRTIDLGRARTQPLAYSSSVRAYVLYEVERSIGARYGSLEGQGYCFFDQVSLDDPADRPRASPSRGSSTRRDASGRRSTTRSEHGPVRRVGWIRTTWFYCRISGSTSPGLPDGRYRLIATADPNNWFREDERARTTTVMGRTCDLRTSARIGAARRRLIVRDRLRESGERPGRIAGYTRPSRMQALWPPRPIAFESVTSTSTRRASFGT